MKRILQIMAFFGLFIGFFAIGAERPPAGPVQAKKRPWQEVSSQSITQEPTTELSEWQKRMLESPICRLPEELHVMIFEKIIPASTSIEDAVERIKNFMFTHKQYANYLDDEDYTLMLINALAQWTNGDKYKAALYLGTKHAQKLIREDMQNEVYDAQGNILPHKKGIRRLNALFNEAAVNGNLTLIKAILALGFDVNTRFENDITPLMFASSRGHLDLVEYLLDRGAQIDLQTVRGSTALLLAINSKHADVAAYLISAGANINLPDHEGRNPLFAAAQVCDVDTFNRLIKAGVNPYLVILQPGSLTRFTLLLMAANAGCTEIVEKLLKEYQFNVNAQDQRHYTALHFAAAKKNLALVKLLLQAGARINAESVGKITPLISAIRSGDDGALTLELVEFLLNSGANMYATDGDGDDILSKVAAKGQTNIVRLLLDKGFNPDGLNPQKTSPLTNAAGQGYLEIAKLLLDRKANVDHQSEQGISPLSNAISNLQDMKNRHAMLDLLIAYRANPNIAVNDARIGQNITPLMFAIVMLDPESLKKLIAAGANINSVTRFFIDGNPNTRVDLTPLMYAIEKANIPMITTLLDAGANTAIKDNRGRTAYRLAQQLAVTSQSAPEEENEYARQMKEVVTLLEQRGIYE